DARHLGHSSATSECVSRAGHHCGNGPGTAECGVYRPRTRAARRSVPGRYSWRQVRLGSQKGGNAPLQQGHFVRVYVVSNVAPLALSPSFVEKLFASISRSVISNSLGLRSLPSYVA